MWGIIYSNIALLCIGWGMIDPYNFNYLLYLWDHIQGAISTEASAAPVISLEQYEQTLQRQVKQQNTIDALKKKVGIS